MTSMSAPLFRFIVAVLIFFYSVCLPVRSATTQFLNQSFSFSWDSQLAVPVPVTTQCDTLNIQWSRASSNTGPDPVAPYYLQVYTSAYVFPFVIEAGSNLNFDWQVPFGPGTLYQICMFDKNGNTGGCQGIYTVIANSTTPTCSNSTLSFPLGPLDVEASTRDGELSQYGWPNQCTDIQVTPKNGTAPYTFTIAPSLHPPWNITEDSADPMNWTIALSWATPFFISVADSAGNYWSYGPLHSGGQGSTSCLSQLSTSNDNSSSETNGVSTGAVVGVGVGGLVAGCLAGFLATSCLLRRRSWKGTEGIYTGLSIGSPNGSPRVNHYDDSTQYSVGPSPSSGQLVDPGSMSTGRMTTNTNTSLLHRAGGGGTYQIEPFVLPGEDLGPRSPLSPREASTQGTSASIGDSSVPGSSGGRTGQVYVVHHDNGRAPVTIYHQDGTEVVELPPRYADGTNLSSSDGQSDGALSGSDGRTTAGGTAVSQTASGETAPSFLQQRRPQPVPRKARNRASSSGAPSTS